MDKTNIKEIEKLVIEGNYKAAIAYLRPLTSQELRDTFLLVTSQNSSIAFCTILSLLLCEREEASTHNLISTIYSMFLCHIEGAYSAALMHARRALVLEPDIMKHYTWLLSFYIIPDRLINSEEAAHIAQHVLKHDPTNEMAQYVLKEVQ